MRIDAHQHFWNYDPHRDTWIDESMERIRRDFLPGDLEPLLRVADMDGCVAVQADQSEEETVFLLDMAARYPFIKGVVGWVDLQSTHVPDRLEYFACNALFKGVRHIAQAEADNFLVSQKFTAGIARLADFGLTYDILIYPRQLPAALRLVERFPEQLFVLDHLAKPRIKDQVLEPWASLIRELAQYENVWCKVSGLVTEADWRHWKPEHFQPYLEVIFEAFGPGRLMFGSDWPVCLLAADYGQVVELVTEYMAPLSAGERTKVMGGNAVAFYGLE